MTLTTLLEGQTMFITIIQIGGALFSVAAVVAIISGLLQ